jgi:large conductance mechanosensitive channel protein
MLKDFKTFIMRGNMMDLAIGIILGASFGGIIKSLVEDILMPPIGLAMGNRDFSGLFTILKEGATPGPYASLAAAKEAGAVTLNYGVFFMAIVNFLIVGFCVFLLVRWMNRLFPKPEPAPAPAVKDCPFCLSSIPAGAKRCPHCTAEL